MPPTMIAAVCGCKYFCMNMVSWKKSAYRRIELYSHVFNTFDIIVFTQELIYFKYIMLVAQYRASF